MFSTKGGPMTRTWQKRASGIVMPGMKVVSRDASSAVSSSPDRSRSYLVKSPCRGAAGSDAAPGGGRVRLSAPGV